MTTRAILILLLLTMPIASPAQPDARQMTLLTNNCVQCHANQETGAPLMGQSEHWQYVRERSDDEVLINVVQGIRGMPPLGYCSACTEEDLKVLIQFMTGGPAASEHSQ